VTIQRLIEPLPSEMAFGRLRIALDDVDGVLTDCTADL
jgi:hypothetical protein